MSLSLSLRLHLHRINRFLCVYQCLVMRVCPFGSVWVCQGAPAHGLTLMEVSYEAEHQEAAQSTASE